MATDGSGRWRPHRAVGIGPPARLPNVHLLSLGDEVRGQLRLKGLLSLPAVDVTTSEGLPADINRRACGIEARPLLLMGHVERTPGVARPEFCAQR